MRKLLDYLRDDPVIRERDEEGRLLASGFKWTEPVAWVVMIFGIGAFVLFFYALAGAMDHRTPPGAAFMVGIASAACVLICILCSSIKRGIAFHSDGRVSLRGGITNWLELAWAMRAHAHAHIASIEVVKTEQGGAGVAVYTTWGGTIILSRGLDEPDARLVAVQLTIALRELRESLTSVQNFQRSNAYGPMRVLID
jgi:hypothetical protein